MVHSTPQKTSAHIVNKHEWFLIFELKDTGETSVYRQGEIVTVRELMVTNGLEVDCLQIEHELHCH